MSYSHHVVTHYMNIRSAIANERKIIKEMVKEERLAMKNLIDYLTSTNQTGIKVDGEFIIELKQVNRVVKNKTEYENSIKHILRSRGVENTNDGLVEELINAKSNLPCKFKPVLKIKKHR